MCGWAIDDVITWANEQHVALMQNAIDRHVPGRCAMEKAILWQLHGDIQPAVNLLRLVQHKKQKGTSS